jgi:hypothetical protein
MLGRDMDLYYIGVRQVHGIPQAFEVLLCEGSGNIVYDMDFEQGKRPDVFWISSYFSSRWGVF